MRAKAEAEVQRRVEAAERSASKRLKAQRRDDAAAEAELHEALEQSRAMVDALRAEGHETEARASAAIGRLTRQVEEQQLEIDEQARRIEAGALSCGRARPSFSASMRSLTTPRGPRPRRCTPPRRPPPPAAPPRHPAPAPMPHQSPPRAEAISSHAQPRELFGRSAGDAAASAAVAPPPPPPPSSSLPPHDTWLSDELAALEHEMRSLHEDIDMTASKLDLGA